MLQGHTARFTLASDMLHDLAAQDSSVALACRLRRYTTPTILAIDKAFGKWNQVFPNAACVVALIDRLLHRAETGWPSSLLKFDMFGFGEK